MLLFAGNDHFGASTVDDLLPLASALVGHVLFKPSKVIGLFREVLAVIVFSRRRIVLFRITKGERRL